MFFSKPIDGITFDDVVEFLKKDVTESIVLDYKLNVPGGLHKVISGFANTFGGHIIIGVEDENDKPKLPFDGIDMVNNFLQQIEQAAVDKVNPPVFVEVKIAENQATKKVFAVIRIPASIATPHVVDNNMIYVRTGQSKKPESIIDPQRLSWIHNHRERTEQLREELVSRAIDRMKNMLSDHDMMDRYAGGSSPSVPHWRFEAIPVFPELAMFSLQDAAEALSKIEVADTAGEKYPRDGDTRLVPGGIQWGWATPVGKRTVGNVLSGLKGTFSYGELVTHGLLYRAASFKDPKRIDLTSIIRSLSALTRSSVMLYEKFGYFGPLQLRCCFRGMYGSQAVKHKDSGRDPKSILDSSFEIVRSMPVKALSEAVEKTVLEMAREIAWCLDIGAFDEPKLRKEAIG